MPGEPAALGRAEVVRIVNSRPLPTKVRVAAPDLERFGKRLQALGRRIKADGAAYDRGEIPTCTT